MDLHEAIDQYTEQKDMHCFEGCTGVENLCRIVRAMGYKDPMYFGQFAQNGYLGDLVEFLEDNSGCIEAMLNWIGDAGIDEWKDKLVAELVDVPDDDPEEGGSLSPAD